MPLPTHVPPELWLEIFKSENLTSQDITSVSMTHRHLWSIAHPLLFHTLSVTPTAREEAQAQAYLARFQNRLNYVSVGQIALSVTTIVVNTVYIARLPADIPPAVEMVMDLLFHALPQFPSLTTFKGTDFRLTAARTGHLLGLPKLRSLCLSLVYGDIFAVPTIRAQSVLEEFVFEPSLTRDIIPPADAAPAPWWTSLLSPTRTRKVHIRDTRASLMFLQWVAGSNPMERLQSLYIASDAVNSAEGPRALIRCPKLQELHLQGQWAGFPVQAVPGHSVIDQVDTVKSISRVSVPPLYASTFAERGTLQEFSVIQTLARQHFETLTTNLISSQATTLTCLRLTVDQLPMPSLRDLVSSVRFLKRLSLRVVDQPLDANEVRLSLWSCYATSANSGNAGVQRFARVQYRPKSIFLINRVGIHDRQGRRATRNPAFLAILGLELV